MQANQNQNLELFNSPSLLNFIFSPAGLLEKEVVKFSLLFGSMYDTIGVRFE